VSNHQKRLSAPDSWPVSRKTETFTMTADAGPHGDDGVPLTILLRDVLGYADSRKEVKYAIERESVFINGDPARDDARPVGMFDILGFPDRGEYYRVFPGEGGRLALTPIDADAAGSKLGKIVGKRQVGGGHTQVNLHDGMNLVLEDAGEYCVGDSLVVDNDDDTVVAHFPYEEAALVTAVQGSHAGEIGRIERIDVTQGSGPNTVVFEAGDRRLETIAEYVVVIDEQFAGDDADADDGETDADADDGETDTSADDGEADAETDDPSEVSDDE
jgi:small subunit ribosomal protein S4e